MKNSAEVRECLANRGNRNLEKWSIFAEPQGGDPWLFSTRRPPKPNPNSRWKKWCLLYRAVEVYPPKVAVNSPVDNLIRDKKRGSCETYHSWVALTKTAKVCLGECAWHVTKWHQAMGQRLEMNHHHHQQQQQQQQPPPERKWDPGTNFWLNFAHLSLKYDNKQRTRKRHILWWTKRQRTSYSKFEQWICLSKGASSLCPRFSTATAEKSLMKQGAVPKNIWWTLLQACLSCFISVSPNLPALLEDPHSKCSKV